MQITSPLWKVTITESDSFRGQEVLDVLVYDNQDEADAKAAQVNSKLKRSLKGGGPIPDCFIFAEVEKVA